MVFLLIDNSIDQNVQVNLNHEYFSRQKYNRQLYTTKNTAAVIYTPRIT